MRCAHKPEPFWAKRVGNYHSFVGFAPAFASEERGIRFSSDENLIFCLKMRSFLRVFEWVQAVLG